LIIIRPQKTKQTPNQQSEINLKMLQQFITLPLTAIAIAYVGLMLFALLRSDSIIFPDIPASYSMGPDIMMLNADDGKQIAAYYLPVENAKRLLIYCHGNGEDIGDARPFLEEFQAKGIAVLAFDYPGYGLSSGKPSESGCFAATHVAYQHAVKELGYHPEQISLYGRSLGGGPACWLAAQEPIGSLILDGTFTSTFRVMTQRKLVFWDVFDNLKLLPKISCPVFVIHGTEDRTVPFSHALRNFDAVQSEKTKLWVEGAGHNNLVEIAGDRYWSAVLNFIQKQRTTVAL